MTESFYRRPLPPSLIAFSSSKGREIFRSMLDHGYGNSFFYLIEQFQTQSEPAYCGVTTLAIILNALEIDPKRVWKGPWRWFAEDLLDCCRPLSEVKNGGITMENFACLAKCNGAHAQVFRNAPIDVFRALIESACKDSGPKQYIALSYSRQALGQTGDGHFSPVGGYDPVSDRVLVLDTARFKYPPYWVPVSTLWEALQPLDSVTNKCRGFVVLERKSDVEIANESRDKKEIEENMYQKAKQELRTDHVVQQQQQCCDEDCRKLDQSRCC